LVKLDQMMPFPAEHVPGAVDNAGYQIVPQTTPNLKTPDAGCKRNENIVQNILRSTRIVQQRSGNRQEVIFVLHVNLTQGLFIPALEFPY
jgi:hypothetical protein